MAQYKKPPAVVSKVGNPALIAAITKLGIRPGGAAVLQVPGRKTGKPTRIPLNPIDIGGKLYLFSPRGTAQWVRNVRAAGGKADLWEGRSRATVTLTETSDPEVKLAVTREYLDRYYLQVGKIVGVPRGASDDVLRGVLDHHPIFEITRD